MDFEEIMDYCVPYNRKVFHDLLSRCKSGYAVPYIGAGLSMFVGLPSWMGFLNKLRDLCPNKNFSLDDPFKAADEIERQLSTDEFYNYFQNEFHHNEKDNWWSSLIAEKNVSNEAISIIPLLFHGPIITSNYDKVTEAIHDFNIDVALPNEIEKLKNTNDEVKHLVYKVHGCISQPKEVVFTGKSYDKYYSRDSNHVKILSKFFKRFNILFLGCSLNMSDSKDKPLELWETLVKSEQQHFAILPCARKNLVIRRKQLEAINIFPIFYPEGRHECVKLILEKLFKEKTGESIKLPEYDPQKHPFVGRIEILNEIKKKLEDENAIVLSLSGLGGIGKTRIACEYAKQNKDKYTSGIYFFHTISEEMVFADVLQFARSKMLVTGLDQSRSDIYEKVGKWMRDNDDWLIILDNVENQEHVEMLIGLVSDQKFHNSKRHFLITTRMKELSEASLKVDVFSEEETRQFFYEFTKREPDEKLNEIAALLGRLPLALEQAASYIAREKISYGDYYHLMDKKGVLELLKEGGHTDETLAVNATYNLSIEKIDSEEAKQLLNLCAYFAPENIKYEWLHKSYNNLKQHPDLCAKVQDTDELKKMIGELVSYSLVHENNGSINIHRLTQAVVRNMVQDNEWLDVCSKTMAEVFEMNNFDVPKAKSEFLEKTPHMEQLFAICEKRKPKFRTEAVGQLYHIYMFGFDKIKEHKIALKYEDRTLKIRKLYSDKKGFAKTLNLVGVVYQNIGEHERSMRFFKEALKIRKSVFENSREKEDELYLAGTYNNIALCFFWKGDYEKSVSFHKLALEIKEKHDNLNDIAISYNNIGALYEAISKRDNYKAMHSHLKAYKIRRNMNNDVNLAYTFNNMGVVEKNMGNYRDALLYLNKALELRETVYGSDTIHTEIAQTCTNIADIYINIGRLKEAKQMLDRAKIIYEEKLTETHIDTSKAYYNLAKWYYVQSLYVEALSWFKRVLDIRITQQKEKSEYDIEELERMINNCRIQEEGGDLLSLNDI